ncbi:MAG: hypothetical protein ABSC38_02985 [Verrucomicrobiia bacterium]
MREQVEKMDRRSYSVRLWQWIWIAFMVLATSTPYLVNYFFTPPGFHYTWIIPPYPEDSLGYMAWSQQAAHGSLLFKVKYTALPHAPFLFHPFFLICGFISSLLACDVGVIHFIARVVGVVLFFVIFFRYIDYLELNSLQSAIATILVGISPGCGYLALAFGIYPSSNYYIPIYLNMPECESNTFWSLLWNPLFPYSLSLLVLSIHLMDRGTREARNRDLWLSGLCVAILTLIHPYQIPLLFAFAVMIVAFRQGKDAMGPLLRFLVPTLPSVLYMFLMSKYHPIAAMHSSSGEMKSSNLLSVAVGFGIPLLLALAGLGVEWRKIVPRYWQLLLWVLLSISFSYLPFWFQRKFIFSIPVPLCILAGISVDWILARIYGERIRRWALVGATLLLLPLAASTQVPLLVSERRIVRENMDSIYYIDTDLLNALNFLKHNSNPDDIVFATESPSELIPAFTGNTVVWGHWAMSVDIRQRTKWFANIFSERSSWDLNKRRREFWGAGIRFIFVSGDLKLWFDKAHPPWLAQGTDKVFENASVIIYRKRDVPM